MKLIPKDFARYKALCAKKKSGKLSEEESQELEALQAKKSSDGGDTKPAWGNDFSWWNKVPELMKDAANIKNNWIAGTPLSSSNAWDVAGVAVSHMVDTYGVESGASSPFNLSIRDLFLRMFRKYRGISAYQASDLGMVMIAAIEVISYVAQCERLYGIINRYARLNVNMPYEELRALGISATDADYIRNHLSDFRYDLNLLIRKASKLCIPKDLSILSDKIALYGYEYKDHESIKSQIILFDKVNYGTFDETSVRTGSCVVFDRLTFATTLNLITPTQNTFPWLENAINKLVGSDSVQKIFGDLTAWFGESQLITLLPLPEDYVVIPEYSESILHKFHNMDIMYSGAYPTATIDTDIMNIFDDSAFGINPNVVADIQSLGKYTIFQDENVIHSEIAITVGASNDGTYTWESFQYNGRQFIGPSMLQNDLLEGFRPVGGERVLDSYHQDYSDEIVCEGMLWKVGTLAPMADDNANGFVYVVSSVAVEICVDVEVFVKAHASSYHFCNFLNGGQMDAVLAMQVFDWSPIIYYKKVGQSNYLLISGDIDNCRMIDSNLIQRIHTAALYSCFKSDVTVQAQ